MQGRFNQWASYTTDEANGQQFYHDLFYRFFFVHEMGHWMEEVVLKQRKDGQTKAADDNSDHNRGELELDANRISVAWWRERDPMFIVRLVGDLRIIQGKLPSPVPAGADIKDFFARNYMKLTEDPNAYGWYQLQMIIVAYDGRPTMSFYQATSSH